MSERDIIFEILLNSYWEDIEKGYNKSFYNWLFLNKENEEHKKGTV